MTQTDISQKYLERLIVFKDNQELASGFLEEKKRDQLLNQLGKELQLDEVILAQRKELAAQAFKSHQLLLIDYALITKAPAARDHLRTKYLKRALALDPYNSEYLKTWLFDKSGEWQPTPERRSLYPALFPPDSHEFAEALAETGLAHHEISYDYLAGHLVAAFVDAVVFSEAQVKAEKENDHAAELNKLADIAGLNASLKAGIDAQLTQYLDDVNAVLDHPFLEWQKCLAAHVAMEQAIDLAPYDREVVTTAIQYYGSFAWRLALNDHTIYGDTSVKPGLYQHLFGTAKPSKALRLKTATAFITKAAELKTRFFTQVLIHQPEPAERRSVKMMYDGTDDALFVRALLEKERLAWLVLSSRFALMQQVGKLFLVYGSLSAIVLALAGYLVYPPLAFVLIPVGIFVVPAILFVLRRKAWRKKVEALD
jgi:hypothetical protein